MARSQNEGMENTGEQLSDTEAWARAAANRKYGIHNGVPYVGAEGHVVPLPAPEGFAAIPAKLHGMIFQALAEYGGNRIAQPAAKANGATRESVVNAVAKAFTDGFEPARTREKDPVDAEVERQFAALVRGKVLEQKPDATDEQIAAFTEKQAAAEAGKAKLAEFRSTILESGTYQIQRKTRKGAVADLGIGEISLL